MLPNCATQQSDRLRDCRWTHHLPQPSLSVVRDIQAGIARYGSRTHSLNIDLTGHLSSSPSVPVAHLCIQSRQGDAYATGQGIDYKSNSRKNANVNANANVNVNAMVCAGVGRIRSIVGDL